MSELELPDAPLVLVQGATELRPLVAEDAGGLAAAAGEERSHYKYNFVPCGVEATQEYVARAIQQCAAGRRVPLTIRWHGHVVGTTSYADLESWAWPPGASRARSPFPDALEIGYTWLAHSAQRTEVNTAAKFLLLRYAFESLGVHRVRLRTDNRNQRSQRAIERLGVKRDGIVRGDRAGVDGTVRDSVFYSLLAPEWPATRQHLQGLLVR